MRHAVPSALAAAAVFSFAAASCDAPAPPPHAAIDATTLQPLLERLDRLIAALQVGAGAPVVAASPGGPGVVPANAAADRVAADSEPSVRRRIEVLEGEVARLLASYATRSFAAAGETPQPKIAQAVAPLAAHLRGNDESARTEARRSLFRLTEQQVLQRLGMPDDVGVREGQLYWGWRDGANGIGVCFVNGLVATVE